MRNLQRAAVCLGVLGTLVLYVYGFARSYQAAERTRIELLMEPDAPLPEDMLTYEKIY